MTAGSPARTTQALFLWGDLAMMHEEVVDRVAAVLSGWNPLGPQAAAVEDLDGYRVEAIDIIFAAGDRPRPAAVARIVRDVLDEAFGLDLTPEDCAQPAKEIAGILSGR
jgi:hypothetical protein